MLERPCPECGFDASDWDRSEVATFAHRNAEDWSSLLREGRVGAGRVDPRRWSSLDYACSVRDVYRRRDARIDLKQTEDNPLFATWDRFTIFGTYAARLPRR